MRPSLRRLTAWLCLSTASLILQPTGAEARKVCVWWDVNAPNTQNAPPYEDEVCSPNVLPDSLFTTHLEPQDCKGVPPIQTSWCVGADLWLPEP